MSFVCLEDSWVLDCTDRTLFVIALQVSFVCGYSIVLTEHFLALRYKRHLFVGKIRGYSIVLTEFFVIALQVSFVCGYSIVLTEHFLALRYKRHLFVWKILGYSIVLIELSLSLRINYCQ